MNKMLSSLLNMVMPQKEEKKKDKGADLTNKSL